MGIGNILSLAWKNFDEKFKNTIKLQLGYVLYAICVYILVAIIAICLNFIPKIGGVLAGIGAVLFFLFIMVPTAFGYIKQFILMYNGEENLKTFAFVDIGKQNRGMALKVSLVLFLKYLIPMVLIFGSIIGMGFYIFSASLYGNETAISNDGTVITLLLSLIAMIAGSIWFFILSLSYSFVNNELAYGENGRTASQIVKESAQIMKGNKTTLFVLQIIVGIFSGIVSALTDSESIIMALIGFVLTLLLYLPYAQYVYIIFYQDIRNKKVFSNEDVQSFKETQNNNENI